MQVEIDFDPRSQWSAGLGGSYLFGAGPTGVIDDTEDDETRVRSARPQLRGQLVGTLVDANQEAGWYELAWSARDVHGHQLPSGLYFYQLKAGIYHETKTMVLLR